MIIQSNIRRERSAKVEAGSYRHRQYFSDIDLVDICTDNLDHSRIAIAALAAGKHVFCEKP
ncbi:Gfo/Idh/MocA family oxidoreductase [Paenibacillus xerothermodurans]|uniref:Gfo/Idh/MocA family oxidoreductase n=1 Tax=Paenibacillus xerothermodurans TaxID=1977292 RepID=UPI001FB2F434|nr:Gfo/Idh/MocA family oxidoreductase [Paenibacillus xerothermodurans]